MYVRKCNNERSKSTCFFVFFFFYMVILLVEQQRNLFLHTFIETIVQTAAVISYECQMDDGRAVAAALKVMPSSSRLTISCIFREKNAQNVNKMSD